MPPSFLTYPPALVWATQVHCQLVDHEEWSPKIGWSTASVSFDNDVDQVRDARLEMIADYYDARVTFEENRSSSDTSGQPPYRPLPPENLYLSATEIENALNDRLVVQFSPFTSPDGIAASAYDEVVSVGARRVPDFAAVRAQAAAAMKKDDVPPDNVFVNVRSRVNREIEEGRRAGEDAEGVQGGECTDAGAVVTATGRIGDAEVGCRFEARNRCGFATTRAARRRAGERSDAVPRLRRTPSSESRFRRWLLPG